ncbi:glycosyltransferase family 39 protein, partial [Shewanella sp.]|uniref:glycosyltransferase family 39 protein n=1 Tax=Shewanella sp. TaxID=50422 RepID=UPI0025832C15
MNKAGLAHGLRLSVLGVIMMLYLSILFNSAMVNDDYMALYTIWRMSIGHVAGIDFNIDSYTLLFDLLTPIASLIGPRFELIFLFRAITLLMLSLISWQLFYLLQIIVSKNISLLAVIFLLICTPMYLRGLDLRPDLFILTLWLQIIIIFNSKDTILSPIKILCVGALIGIGFLFKFKSIIIVLPLVLFFMQEMIIERRKLSLVMAALAYLFLGMGLVFIPYAWMLGFDSVLQGYVSVTAKLMASSINGEISVAGLKLAVFKQAFNQDALFWIFALTGAVLFVVRTSKLSMNKRFSVYYLL